MSIGKFSEFYVDVTKDATKIPQEQYLAAGRYPIIDQGQKSIAGMWDNPDGLYEKVPAIVFGDHTRTIKYVDTPFFIGADGVKVLRPVQAGDNVKYLFYVLQAARIPNLGYSRHFKVVKELKIRMYPRKKQDEIVRVLEQIDSLLEQRQNEILQMDQLVKSRFVEMFGDNETNPFGWRQSRVGDCCTLKSGTSLPAEVENEGGPIPYVKVGDMNYPGNEKYITTSSRYVSLATAGNGIFEVGSIIFPKRGGAIGTNKKRMTKLPISADLNIMGVSSKGALLPEYLLVYFDMIDLGALSDGSSVPQINNKNIAPLRICLPPMELQKEFAAFVAEVDKSKFRIQKSLSIGRKLWTVAQIDAIMNMDFSTQRSL